MKQSKLNTLLSLRCLLAACLSSALMAEPCSQQAGCQESAQRQNDLEEAQFAKARNLLRGESGEPRDVQKSFELMKAAASGGHAEAMGGVGYFYANGIAVPQNDELAVEWFRKGAEAGGPKAALNLGKMLLSGKGTPQNIPEAITWITKAADADQTDACFFLGSIYYFGDHGQPVDNQLAFPRLLKAAENGHREAQNMVGFMYESGRGVPVDTSLAEAMYRKAALQGHAKAQNNLGQLLGIESTDRPRRMEALKWLLLSAQSGEITAQRFLEENHSVLKQKDIEEAKESIRDFRPQPTKPSQ